jgi:2'-5' RNA ligase
VSERLRLFVALDLPARVRSALAAWCECAAPEGVRRVPAANLHLTLAFLGSRSAQDASLVAGLLPALARDVGTLETAGALWLPPRRPGVLAVALGGGGQGLGALQSYTQKLWMGLRTKAAYLPG